MIKKLFLALLIIFVGIFSACSNDNQDKLEQDIEEVIEVNENQDEQNSQIENVSQDLDLEFEDSDFELGDLI